MSKPFGKCANSFLVRSLKCCLDRTHLAEHQFAEKLAVIIARCNRFVFGKTSGKRNSQLRKTAVARPPYKPRHGRHTDPRPRRNKILAAFWPVLCNTVIVGLVLALTLDLPVFLTMGEVGLGELAVVYTVGMAMLAALKRVPKKLLGGQAG